MKTDQLIERVKKLLALAGNNPNENEAAQAMEKASRLMAEHNLTSSQINQKDESEERTENVTEQFEAREKWVRLIWYATANLNFCKYWFSKRVGYQTSHNLIGTKANVASTEVMAQYLVETVTRLAWDAPIAGRQRGSFKLGAATRLSQRMNELKRNRAKGADQTTNGTNLPALSSLYLYHEQDNEAWFKKNHAFKLRKGQRSKVTDAAAFGLGMQAGNSISLNTQVDKRNQS